MSAGGRVRLPVVTYALELHMWVMLRELGAITAKQSARYRAPSRVRLHCAGRPGLQMYARTNQLVVSYVQRGATGIAGGKMSTKQEMGAEWGTGGGGSLAEAPPRRHACLLQLSSRGFCLWPVLVGHMRNLAE